MKNSRAPHPEIPEPPLGARWDRSHPRVSPARVVFGLLLVGLGVLALLERSTVFDLLGLLTYFWPLLFLGAGLWKLLAPGSRASRVVGALFTGWGAVWLLDELGWLPFDAGELWPLLLVAFGGLLLFRSRAFGRGDDSASVDAFAFLGGKRRTSSTGDFRGGDLMAVMGGCEVDLRGARMADGRAVIDAFALWGGVEIQVPLDWQVRVQGVPILGGFDDKTRPPEPGAEAGELIVKGVAIMGAVEVSN